MGLLLIVIGVSLYALGIWMLNDRSEAMTVYIPNGAEQNGEANANQQASENATAPVIGKQENQHSNRVDNVGNNNDRKREGGVGGLRWGERAQLVFNALLTLATVALAVYAAKTLRQIEMDSLAQGRQFTSQLELAKQNADAATNASNAVANQTTTMASQLSAMNEQVAVAAKTADASERASFANRAWLSVEFLEIGEPRATSQKGISDELAAMSVRLSIQNYGATPARINSIEASLFVVPSDYLNPTDFGVTKIDPDNPAHAEHNVGPASTVTIANRTIVAPVLDFQSGGGEIRQEVNIPGNGSAVPMLAEFVFPAPYSLLYRDLGQTFPRYDFWIHIEIPYLDVYRKERRTCFFAHIEGSAAYWADHISSERHNYQR